MNTVFARAVETTGPEYLALESELRTAARSAPAEIESAARSHPDPMALLLATVLVDWAGPRQSDFIAALEYLDGLPAKLERSIIQTPPPVGVAGYLTRNFSNRVAEMLALRLVKQPEWPEWKAGSVVLYLKEHKVPSTTSALIRFAMTTTSDRARELALQAVREIKDPQLPAKLAFEVARAKSLGLTVPAAVRAL